MKAHSLHLPVDAGFDRDLRSGSYQTFLWMPNLTILVSPSQDGTPRSDRASENHATISNSSFRGPRYVSNSLRSLKADSCICPDSTSGELSSTFLGRHSKHCRQVCPPCRVPEQDDRTVPCSHIRWGKDDCRQCSRERPIPSSWDLEVCRETFLQKGPELQQAERALLGKSPRQSYEGGFLHAEAVE